MNRKRVLLGFLLPIFALTLSACDFLPTNIFGRNSSSQSSSRRIRSHNSDSSSYDPTHVHRFSPDWSYNAQYHWHDAVCGHDEKDGIAPHDIYSEIIKESTCQETGLRQDICNICGYSKTVTTPVSDHAWSEYARKDPTCTQEGYVKKYCTVCNRDITVVLEALDHDFEILAREEPTCSQYGSETRHCLSCDYNETVTLDKLPHDLVEVETIPSTCSTHGYIKEKCTLCNEIINYELPLTDHIWSGNETYVSPDNGVPYHTDMCLNCGASKIAIAASSAYTDGGFKPGIAFDNGYVKLMSNGTNMELDFQYPNAAYAKLYQHAICDNWSNGSYINCTYRSTNAYEGGDTEFNFIMECNGQMVDLTESSEILYLDFFNYGEQIQGLMDEGYSPAANCLIGDVSLVAGMNSLKYTRLSSYTLNIDYFVLVITDTTHQHTFSSSMFSDETYHWNQCLDPNCPMYNGIVNKNEHTFTLESTDYDDSCSDLALYNFVCTTCGYQSLEYHRPGHYYGDSATTYVTNTDSYQLSIDYCSVCHKSVEAFDFSFARVYEGSNDSGRLSPGTTIGWHFPVSRTGIISFYLPLRLRSESYQGKYFEPNSYSVNISGTDCAILIPNVTYQELCVSKDALTYVKFANYEVTDYDVAVGQIDIRFTSNAQTNYHIYEGQVRIEY